MYVYQRLVVNFPPLVSNTPPIESLETESEVLELRLSFPGLIGAHAENETRERKS